MQSEHTCYFHPPRHLSSSRCLPPCWAGEEVFDELLKGSMLSVCEHIFLFALHVAADPILFGFESLFSCCYTLPSQKRTSVLWQCISFQTRRVFMFNISSAILDKIILRSTLYLSASVLFQGRVSTLFLRFVFFLSFFGVLFSGGGRSATAV